MRNRRLTQVIATCSIIGILFGNVETVMAAAGQTETKAQVVNEGVALENQDQDFTINNEEDFIAFIENCRKNSWSKDRNIILNTDISLADIDFQGIPSFSGHFEGNGHTISNVIIKDGDEAMGLFRYLEKDGEIADLIVSGTIISSDSRDLVGGVVGVNSGTIINCEFHGRISGLNVAGGIAGLNGVNGQIIECVNHGFVTSTTNVGGIVGVNRGYILDCTNAGNVNSDSSWVDGEEENESVDLTFAYDIFESGKNIGGIAGWNNGVVATSTNKGVVGYLKSGENVGGIVGSSAGNIFYCKNMGRVYGKQDVGGIVGQFEPTIVIKDIQEIKNEVDALHDILDKSSTDVDKASDKITEDFSELNDKSNNVTDKADSIASEGIDVLETNTDVANDLSDRSDYVTRHAEPINGYISTAFDDLDKLNEILDKVEKDVEMSSADKDKLKASRNSINDKTKELDGTVSENLAKSVDIATDIASDVNDIAGVVAPYVDDTSDALSKDLKDANDTADNLVKNLQKANDETGAVLNYINSKDKLELMNFSESFDKDMDDLKDEVDSTLDSMDKINKDASKHSDILEEDMKLINDQMQKVTDLVIDRIGNMENLASGEDIIVDVSDKDPSGEQSASITGCSNEGRIDGNTNVGGVVGSIGMDVTNLGDNGLGSKYEVSAVLLGSSNVGFITFKNKNAGGIVGNATAGYIADCYSQGGVFTTDGNYVGGIAGMSSGTIVSCNSLAVLAGNEYVGGIAGSADDVHGCNAMPTIMNSNGRKGAIMGAYQSDNDDVTVYHQGMSDHIYDNHFVSEDLFGIDNVSYIGVAEPYEYSELIEKSPIFKNVRIYFVDEDYGLVSEMQYRFGASLEGLSYPEIPTDSGTYAEWQTPENDIITSNLVLQSQVVDNVMILASEYKENGKSLALAEGVFTKEAKLSVMPSDEVVVGNPQGIPANAIVSKYQINLENAGVSENQIVNIRLLQANEGNMTIYELADGNWKKMEASEIGSYWQGEMVGDSMSICLVTVPSNNNMLYWAIGGGVAAVIVILLAVMIGKKSKKHAGHKE